MKINNLVELEKALLLLADRAAGLDLSEISEGAIEFWNSDPTRFVFDSNDTADSVLSAFLIETPAGFKADKEAFLKFIGFDKFFEPKNFCWAGTGEAQWLVELKVPVAQALAEWVAKQAASATGDCADKTP